MDIVELMVGIAEIAVAMAGFTGVVVASGGRSQGAWHPGDRFPLAVMLNLAGAAMQSARLIRSAFRE